MYFRDTKYKLILILFISILLFFLFPILLHATAFTVNNTADRVDANPGDGLCADGIGNCTLRAAIQEANSLVGADIINVPAGTYVLSIQGLSENNAATGDLDITENLAIVGDRAATTIISANKIDRVFHIVGSIDVQFSDVGITEGSINVWNPPETGGGGIYNQGGAVTLKDVIISKNDGGGGGGGGGIHNLDGTLNIENSSIIENIGFFPGGIGSNGTSNLTLVDSIIINNADVGLVIHAESNATVTVINTEFSGNGDGMYMHELAGIGSSMTVKNCTFNSNGRALTAGLGTITNSTFNNNGTAIWALGTITVQNCSFSGNSGESYNQGHGTIHLGGNSNLNIMNSTIGGSINRGGITIGDGSDPGGTVTLINSTVAGNSGGGIVNRSGVVRLTNSIVANNSIDDCSDNFVTSLGHNLDSDGSCNLTEPSDLPNTDPLLGEFTDDGTPGNGHFPLLATSQAIDKGDDAACPPTDQLGNPRVDGDGDGEVNCDIGAIELDTAAEVIIDNSDSGFSSGPSAWRWSQCIPGGYNNSYQYAPPGDGRMWAKWSFTLDSSSNHEIFAQWTSFANRPPAAPYTIFNNGTQILSVTVDQTINGGRFISLGTYYLEAGAVDVVLNNTPSGYAVADAVKIEYRGGGNEPILSRIEIEGPDSVNEGSDANYACRAYYSDNTNAIVSADNWTDTCNSAGIDMNGRLRAFELDSNEQCRITADYTEDGVNKSGVKDITIIDTDTPEIIIDNEDAGFSSGPSAWRSSQSVPNGYNNSYQYAPPGDGSMWAMWQYTVESYGNFDVFAYWTAHENRSPTAPFTLINNGTQISSVTVDQTVNGGWFISLGTYYLEAGDVEVVLNNTPTGYVIADAIKLVRRGDIGILPVTVDNTDPDFTKSGNWGTSSFIPGYYGTNYMYATPDGSDKWAKWTFLIYEPYDYEINAQWAEFENRSPTANYSIINNGIDRGTVAVDQTQNGGRLNKLGTFFLESGNLEVILNKSPGGCVIADVVQIVPR